MFIWQLDKAGAFILAMGVVSSIMLAVLNILYGFMHMEWIITACRINGLVTLCAIAVLVHHSTVSKQKSE